MPDSLTIWSFREDWEWAEWIEDQLLPLGWNLTLEEIVLVFRARAYPGVVYIDNPDERSQALSRNVLGIIDFDHPTSHGRGLEVTVKDTLQPSSEHMQQIDLSRTSESEARTRLTEAVKNLFGRPTDAYGLPSFSMQERRSLLVPFPGARLNEEAPTKRAETPVRTEVPAIPPVTVDFSNSDITKITETTRREQPIGEEKRKFDLSRTSASSVETIGLSHTAEWAVNIDTSRIRTTGGNAHLSVLGLASVSPKIENSLTARYSAAWKQSISRQQTTSVSVPAGKKVLVTVRWKRIWQGGDVMLAAAGHSIAVPFEVTVMLGFDTEMTDLNY